MPKHGHKAAAHCSRRTRPTGLDDTYMMCCAMSPFPDKLCTLRCLGKVIIAASDASGI